jgi:lauroyl/myristoyl acyltransferase
MKNPEKLVNNAVFRNLVRFAGPLKAREAIRRTLRPIVLPPRKMRALRGRVVTYLQRYFPDFDEAEVQRRADAFVYHWGAKFAEDCVVLNVANVEQVIHTCQRYVEYVDRERAYEALDRGAGTLFVGSHVGAVAFGVLALATLYFLLPPEQRPDVRVCAEPEVERFPQVVTGLEQAIRDYGARGRFLFPAKDRQAAAREIAEVLQGGGVVTTNLDVLVGGSSRRVFTLFGRARVYLPALVGAARSALRSGATVVPWVGFRTEHGFRLCVEPPIGPVPCLGVDVPDDHPELMELCERLRQALERWIVAQPEQWVYWDRLHQRLVQDAP